MNHHSLPPDVLANDLYDWERATKTPARPTVSETETVRPDRADLSRELRDLLSEPPHEPEGLPSTPEAERLIAGTSPRVWPDSWGLVAVALGVVLVLLAAGAWL